MKKFVLVMILVLISAIIAIIFSCSCSGCNKQIFDLQYSFDYARIYDGMGNILKEGKVATWKDYDGEQLQIKFDDGEIWLTNSVRCDLIDFVN